ncbi:MAG: metallophosphoesterase family protein, partial [Acidobacteriota bacterium]
MGRERTIVHLSDLHFGSLNELTVRPLVDALVGFHPDVIAVSGDLTQRARIREFNQARAFLDELPSPQIVVPGNHDVPLHNLFSRFWHRLARYCQYITPDLEPFWADKSIAIAGINTARSATIKSGRVSRRQVARICERFQAVPPGITRIIVAHHPFDLPEGVGDHHLVGRAARAMELFARSEIDVFLTGHLHTSRTRETAAGYRISGRSA